MALHRSSNSSRRQRRSLLMVAAIGIALALSVFHLLSEMEQGQRELAFSRDAQSLAGKVNDTLNHSAALVGEVAWLVEREGCGEPGAFTRWVAAESAHADGVVAMAWAPAGGAAATLPIACRFAPGSPLFPLGMDLNAEPALAAALEQARRARGEGVVLLDGERFAGGDERGVVVMRPLFDGESGPLKGFVVGLFGLEPMVDEALAVLDGIDYRVEVIGDHGERLARRGVLDTGGALLREARFTVAGHPLTVRVGAPADYRPPGTHGDLLALAALLITLLLTASLLGYLRALHTRADALQRLADSRQSSEKMALQHEQILQSLGEGVYGIDRDGRTTFFNRAAERILGWGEGELLGRSQHELFHHTRTDGTPYPVKECPIHGTALAGECRHVEEESFWHRDGYAVPVEYTSAPLFDDDGEPNGAVVVFSDITQRLVTEAQMQRENELLARIMDTSPSGVLVANHRGRFVFTNQRALEIFLRSREGLLERDFSSAELQPRDEEGTEIPEERLPFQRIVAERQPLFDFQFSILRGDGQRRLLSVNGAPVYDSVGRLERVVYTLGDITSRKAAEQERIRFLGENRRLTRQLFNIQEEERRAIARDLHDELGQYLVAMRTELKLIGRFVGEEAAERMSPLLDLLDQTHGVVRGIIHRLRPVLLEKLGLHGAVDDLVERWRERHPEVAVELHLEGELAEIENDVAHTVYRLVQEGLTNIDKYAEARRVEVAVRVHEEPAGEPWLRVVVIDDGRGFQQVRSGGMGQLGMRERVVSLNGRFSVRSEPGEGVVLTAEIPLAAGDFE